MELPEAALAPAAALLSLALAAALLSLHPNGGPRSIPTLYYANGSTRPFLRGATPLATVRHGALPSAREGPWCVISSSARLHGLCKWVPKALATSSERGRSLRGAVLCRRGTLYPLALPQAARALYTA